MAYLGKKTKWDIHTGEESLVEQEHKDSCDINKMIKSAFRGQQVNGGKPVQYGHDDMTIDGVQYRIRKQQLENELEQVAQNQEFTEEELKYIPEKVREKIKFKIRKKEAQTDQGQTQPPKNDQTKKEAQTDQGQTQPPKNISLNQQS